MRYLIGAGGSGAVGATLSFLYPKYPILSLMIFGIWTFIVFCLGREEGREEDVE